MKTTTLIHSAGYWAQMKATLDWHSDALRRLQELRTKNFKPVPLCTTECLELLGLAEHLARTLERENRAYHDALLADQTMLADQTSEARAIPARSNPHND
jgi:hypothetical protein